MKLKICGYNGAKKIIESNWQTKLISIVDSDISRIVPDNENNITGIFYDTLTHPTKEKLVPIFDFFKSITNNDNVLIHCSAGISRSTACALTLLISKGFSYEDALKIVYKARPQACPNDTVIKLYDDYSGMNGELIKKYNVTKGEFITNFNNYVNDTNDDDLSMGFSDLLKSYSALDEATDEELMAFDEQIDKDAEHILNIIKKSYKE